MRRLGLLTAGGAVVLALLAVALGSVVQEIGCNQKAHYALVRALADGTSIVDEYQPESCDLAYTDGHYYAAKAPGLAFAVLPVYVTLDALGAVPDDPRTAVWLLGLFGSLLPSLVAAAIAARLAERVAAGTGVLVGATLLLATLALPFSTLLFAHALAAALAVAGLAVLWRERPRVADALVAGLLVGLAATVEHPTALVALPLAVYAWHRGGARHAGGFLAGCAVGFAPVLAYNWWSFGSVLHFAVVDTISVAGDTGHDVVGGHERGVFGAVAPSAHVGLELLASAKGLLALSPVLAAALVGLVLLARRGLRAEAAAVGAAFGLYLLWNSGLTAPFGGPFGGDSPGARYLVPVLPFLAPGLALAFRRAFLPTALLAGVSFVYLALATATEPMLDGFRTAHWWELASAGDFTSSVVTLLDGPAGVTAVLPFLIGTGAAAAIAAVGAPRPRFAPPDAVAAAGALLAWAILATGTPPLLERGHTVAALAVVLAAGLVAYVGFRGGEARGDAAAVVRGARGAPHARSVLLAGLLAVALLLAWHGATSLAPSGGYDGDAHVEYAEHLRATGDLPAEADTYEFASPPAYQWLAVQGQRAAGALAHAAGQISDGRSSPAGRLLWLALLVAGLWLAGTARRRLGLVLLAAAAVLLALEVVLAAVGTEWRVGQVLSVAAAVGMLVLTWLLGREAWPGESLRPAAAAAGVAALPLVFRLGAMFHPESVFAVLAVAALLVTVRAQRRAWPLGHAALLGALLGLAALTRQTALVVVAALGLAVLLAGRRRALGFAAVAAGVLLLVAGPWWLHQYDRYGNPIQSNLEREGYLLEDGQPLSFFVSLPLGDLVVHPYRPSFQNELLPMLHADLWSDWFGGQHGYWVDPGRGEKLFASTQSVLGLPVSVLGIFALFALGVPALRRLLAGGARGPDFLFAAAFLLAVLTWAAFVVTLVRFPQAEGDPVKASYMLFLAPVFVLVLVHGAAWLWRRGPGWRRALLAWGVLYAVSYSGYLLTAW